MKLIWLILVIIIHLFGFAYWIENYLQNKKETLSIDLDMNSELFYKPIKNNLSLIKPLTPSIPALLIIGPSKTATSSLITHLSILFPHWKHAHSISSDNKSIPHEFGKLNGDFYRKLIVNETTYKMYMQKLNNYDTNHKIKNSFICVESPL